MLQNNRKEFFSSMWRTFGRKTDFVKYLSPFSGLIKKICLNKSKYSSAFTLFKYVKKNKFPSISLLLSEIATFWTKKSTSQWISPKCFITTVKHSLTVCGTHWGEMQFLLIFTSFYWFDQKKLFKQIQFFITIYPFQIC